MMSNAVPVRLAVMMALFYFGLGSWIVTLSTYLMSAPADGGLGFTSSEVGWVYSTFALAGLAAPLSLGVLADKLFRAERVLAAANLGCAASLLAAGRWCATAPPGGAFGPLFALMLAQCVFMQVAMTLTTVIALRHLPDPAAGFSRVRLWGTVGWIGAGNAVGFFLTAVSPGPLFLAAAAHAVLAGYAVTLPATRPKGGGRTVAEAVGLPALRLLRDRSFGVFLLVAFGATVLNQFYVVYAHRFLRDLGVPRPEQVMTVAQGVEVGCMAALPLLHPGRHLKAVMTLGLLGWAARAAALGSLQPAWVIGVGVSMHGWSYAFFHVVAATYVDRKAPAGLRASAQGLVAVVCSGAGPLVGNLLAAAVVDAARVGPAVDWPRVWAVPLAGTLVLVAAFVGLFRPPARRSPGEG